jgi:hypothetical protein
MLYNGLNFCIFWNKLHFVILVFIKSLEGALVRTYRMYTGGIEWTRMFLEDIHIVSD